MRIKKFLAVFGIGIVGMVVLLATYLYAMTYFPDDRLPCLALDSGVDFIINRTVQARIEEDSAANRAAIDKSEYAQELARKAATNSAEAQASASRYRELLKAVKEADVRARVDNSEAAKEAVKEATRRAAAELANAKAVAEGDFRRNSCRG